MERFAKFVEVPEKPPIEWVLRPFQRFTREEAAGGILLLLCAVAALAWANSPWESSYEELWETHLRLGLGDFFLDETLHFWINDALMAIFFFVVGLEIKRSVLVGELSSPRRAALPVVAALGGMLLPAAIYLALNAGTEGVQGWGIPMATDIAFSLGVLAILGSRVPPALKVFLTAFAIADDLGAVAVIALFYTEEIVWSHLAVGGGGLAALVAANWLGIRHPLVYGVLGAVVWLAFLKSGIHATVAGIAVAATIPTHLRIDPDEFLRKGRTLLEEFEQEIEVGSRENTTVDQTAAIRELEQVSKHVETPLQRMEHGLHPWVVFLIIPLFALSNAGVQLGGNLIDAVTAEVTLGVFLGLVLGKQVGVTLFTWIAIRSGLATMPRGMTWRHIYGVAWLGGIGFTMSLFITGLALTDAPLVSEAKIGILGASIVSGVVGWLTLRSIALPPEHAGSGGDH